MILVKNKVHNHEKQRKLVHVFLNSKNMANFEATRFFISSGINISFLEKVSSEPNLGSGTMMTHSVQNGKNNAIISIITSGINIL